jgi:PAS domain S-box-containing protein
MSLFKKFLEARREPSKMRFSTIILIWMIIVSVIPIIFIGFFLSRDRAKQFTAEKARLRANYYFEQTIFIKNKVDQVFDEINAEVDFSKAIKKDIIPSRIKENENNLKKYFLNRVSKISFGREGYVFINTMDNQSLIFDGKYQPTPIQILKSGRPEWISSYKKMQREIVDGKGHYFEYKFKKHSSDSLAIKLTYVKLFKPYGWMIGSGIYYDELNSTIESERLKLRESIINDLYRIFFLIFIVIIILIFINHRLSKYLYQNIKTFKNAFSKASDDFSRVDIENIKYEEFLNLARAANKMIEERNKFFDALLQEEILLRSLIDAVPNLIFYKDKESRYLGCNRAYTEYMGKNEKDIIGKTDIDLLGYEQAKQYHESDKKVLSSKEVLLNEEVISFPDGHEARYETIKTIFTDVKGDVQGIIGISHDITLHHQMLQDLNIAKEKAEESDRLKTAFLANMSHEIRTPLNAIIGFSNLLVYEDDLSFEEKETYNRMVSQSGDSLANLINDIVDMAKIEAGQVDIEKEDFLVSQIMDDLFILYKEQAAKQNDNLQIIYKPDPDHKNLILHNDKFRMKQVMVNLMNNALKFTEKGEITFGFKVDTDYCSFYVSDTGIGIKEDSLKVIFDVFTQIDGTYSRKYGGVGLGLSISKRLLNLMGGDIWVNSKPGEGSTFTFTLPLK